jgi:hypothetical protein
MSLLNGQDDKVTLHPKVIRIQKAYLSKGFGQHQALILNDVFTGASVGGLNTPGVNS